MERATLTMHSRGLSDEEDESEESPMRFEELEEVSPSDEGMEEEKFEFSE